MKITMESNLNPQSFFLRLWNGILCFFLLFGLSLSLYNWTGNKVSIVVTLSFALIFSLVLCLLLGNKTYKLFFYVIPIVIAVAMVIIWYRSIFNGFVYVHNSIMDLIGIDKGLIMTKLQSEGRVSTFDVTIGSIFFINVLSLPIAISVKSNKVLVPIVCVLSVSMFGLYVGKVSYMSVALMFLSVVALVLKKCFRYINANDKKLFFTRVLVLTVALVSVIAMVKTTAKNKVGFLDSCNKSVVKSVDKIRYGENILPNGNFSDLGSFEPTDKPRLEIVMSDPESYYLRGYVGEKYTSSGWTNLDNSKLYKNSDLFYWLHQNSFYGQTQISNLAGIVNSDIKENRISIKNLSASKKYIYAPYELLSDKNSLLDHNKIGDKNIQTKGFFPKESYTYYCVNNQVKSYTSIAERLYDSEKNSNQTLDEYLKNESHYNKFVYENYLDIPDNVKSVLINLLGEYDKTHIHLDYGEAKQKILAYLTTNMEYNSSPKKCSRDFVTGFLQETKEGYSVHFATAATLMFRYFGIPARYVEGYIVTPENINGKLKSSAIVLNDTNAHAWTEFYQDGVGWIPFETTPEYLDEMEKADALKGVSVDDSKNKYNEDKLKKDNAKSKEGIDEFLLQEDNKTNWSNFVIILSVVMLLSLVVVAVVINILRRNKLKNIYKTFEGDDLNLSINNLFAYSCFLLEKFHMNKNSFGEDYFNSFEKSLDIFNEAVYSNHSMLETQREVLIKFEKLTVNKIKQNRTRLQIFKDKYIKHLYF